MQINDNNFGIPQGTPISANLSNIYMIDFDYDIANAVEALNGKYLRYADDFIIVIPKANISLNQFKNYCYEIISNVETKYFLSIQTTKTHFYIHQQEKNFEFNFETQIKNESIVDYLGFIFDGKTVKMRQKSIAKYYRGIFKTIDSAKKRSKRSKSGKRLIGKRNLHRYYSDLGEKDDVGHRFGNFVTYTKRAQRYFDDISPETDNKILDQIKNRKNKIINRINKP